MSKAGTIGKKGKKRKVRYVKRAGKQKSVLPLVLGGGILAYFLFSSKAASAQAAATATNTTPGAGGDPLPAAGTGAPIPAGTPFGGLPTHPLTPQQVAQQSGTPYVEYGSAEQMQNLVNTRTLLYQTLLYDDNYPDSWKDTFTKIYTSVSAASGAPAFDSVIQELRTAVEYINNFFEPKRALDPTSPLGLAVKMMHNKYGIF